jgi:hypothetical protein
MAETKQLYHGWYSQKQKDRKSDIIRSDNTMSVPISNIYKHVDGREVEITSVSSTKTPPNFDDVKYVGQCTNWLRSVYKSKEN